MVSVVELVDTPDCGSGAAALRVQVSSLTPKKHKGDFMKAKLECPKCGHKWEYGYWQWIWKAQMHWLVFKRNPARIRDYRKTKCPNCGQWSWIARAK